MKQRALIMSVVFILLLTWRQLALCSDPKEFQIGALLPMTGAGSWYGQVQSGGVLTAINELNGKGGIDGVKFRVIIEDHQSGSGAAAINAFNKLVNVDKIPFCFSSYGPPTLSILPMANEHHVLIINGGGTAPYLVGASPYLFNNRVLSTAHGAGVLKRAKERGFTKMAELYWIEGAGLGTKNYVEPVWKSMGGTVVGAEGYQTGITNFNPYLNKLIAAKPDFLCIWNYGKDIGVAIKQAREMGFTDQIMGIDVTPDAIKLAGFAAEGYECVTDYFDPRMQDPWTKTFVDDYRAKYNKEPEMFAANYYEGMYILAALIKKAKTKGSDYWNGKALRDALVEIKKFSSVYGGEVEFNIQDGTCRKKIALLKVKGGESTFQKYLEIQ